MRNPKDYWKSALVGQILATAMYIIIGSVVYTFAGTCESAAQRMHAPRLQVLSTENCVSDRCRIAGARDCRSSHEADLLRPRFPRPRRLVNPFHPLFRKVHLCALAARIIPSQREYRETLGRVDVSLSPNMIDRDAHSSSAAGRYQLLRSPHISSPTVFRYSTGMRLLVWRQTSVLTCAASQTHLFDRLHIRRSHWDHGDGLARILTFIVPR